MNEGHRSSRILVVEDEPVILELVRILLEGSGYAPVVIGDALKALEVVQTQAFDVVVTDLAMPRLPGPELVRAVRRHHPGTQVVLLTGAGPLDGTAMTVPAPYTLLEKPFAIADLLEAVAQAVALAHAERGRGHAATA
jgi:DNA-binding NtrC family response regulator